jgi:hypothetical protein
MSIAPPVPPGVSTRSGAESCTRARGKAGIWGIELSGSRANNPGYGAAAPSSQAKLAARAECLLAATSGVSHALAIGIEPFAGPAGLGRLLQRFGQELRLGKRLQLTDDIRVAVLRDG